MRRKKDMTEEKNGVMDHIADSFGASKEILTDAPRLIFIGNKDLTIENYKGIVEYTDSVLIIETKPHQLKIEGKSLEVKTITQEMLCVKGTINQVEFRKEG